MEKGSLIVSTKKAQTKRLTLVGICGVIMIGFGLLCIIFSDIFDEVFGSAVVAYVVGIAMIAYPAYQFLVIWLGQKSYVEVYENCIEGITALSGKSNMEQFQLQYPDILNVSASKYRISIHTQYATYEVQAMVNKDRAVEVIRNQIAAKKVTK